MNKEMTRYSVIREKNPREIVLLRGSGCKWRRCAFCDYHLDSSPDQKANFALNREVLSHVTGEYRHLEVINSGSFCDLDPDTLSLIQETCERCEINLVHFECHWIHRGEIPALRQRFAGSGIQVKIKTGVETFDLDFREKVLKKGIPCSSPEEISKGFDEVCLLFGITGQTKESMLFDIRTGLAFFERVCVNIMTENSTSIHPDPRVIEEFMDFVYPLYREDPRVDILLTNTDFGVGEKSHEE